MDMKIKDGKNTEEHPMFSVKAFRRWHWIPIYVFAIGVFSIVMLIWVGRLTQRQQRDFDLSDALMDIQIRVATSHFMVEEAISGDEEVDIREVKNKIDSAMSLAGAVLNGGKSEHGQILHPLKDPKLFKRMEDIKSLITRYKTLVLQRIQNPDTFRTGSTPYQDFHTVFAEIQSKGRALEMFLEKDQIRTRTQSNRFSQGILVSWASIVIVVSIWFWSQEVKRRAAEMMLEKVNEKLRSQAEELEKFNLNLEELVEKRTMDLVTSNWQLEEEIRERNEIENSLRASEKKFRTLVENLPLRISLKDENSVYLYCNDGCARDLNTTPDEIPGKSDYDFYPKKLAECHVAEDRRIFESDRVEEIEERYYRNGREVVIHKIKVPIKNERDGTRSLLGIAWDITERIRLESIAEAANLMENIGYVFSGIRHEIGNPINSIKMTLGTLASKIDTASTETIKKYVEWIAAEISGVEYLLKALKNFNMYETPELQNVGLQAFTEKFLSLVASDFEKKGILIKSLIHPEAQWGYADPRALQQVMLNILSNASDAVEGKEDPEILIEVLKTDGLIRIEVTDNGSGMTEEQQEELFKPFRTTKVGGTGLGLVIAKKMLAGMKGTIEIKSKKNEGTRVSISLSEGREIRADT
jgi:PAS domain S-box-containing protein